MKGTIDVQIRHKDGSTETRHEHNVVFDLQALQTKMFYERPYCSLVDTVSRIRFHTSTFNTFSLSTLEINTSRPSFPITALTTTTSSSSTWYSAPMSSTTSEKSVIRTATWTMQEAMTLKSIFFTYQNPSFYAQRAGCYGDGFYPDANGVQRLKPPQGLFKFTNSGLGGFATSAGAIDASYIEEAFVPYKLHDPSERFVFSYQASNSTRSFYVYPAGNNPTLYIKDAATNTVKRSFLLSQFEGYSTSNNSFVRVINTGAKNFLLQYFSDDSGKGFHAWEIPDSESNATISTSGDITFAHTLYSANVTIVDNIIAYVHSGSDDKGSFAVIHDDLSVETVPGRNMVGTSALSNRNLMYRDTSAPPFLLYSSNGWSDAFNGYYQTLNFINSTAANFSTPIVLAEGDVLTVSYKIEVS